MRDSRYIIAADCYGDDDDDDDDGGGQWRQREEFPRRRTGQVYNCYVIGRGVESDHKEWYRQVAVDTWLSRMRAAEWAHRASFVLKQLS